MALSKSDRQLPPTAVRSPANNLSRRLIAASNTAEKMVDPGIFISMATPDATSTETVPVSPSYVTDSMRPSAPSCFTIGGAVVRVPAKINLSPTRLFPTCTKWSMSSLTSSAIASLESCAKVEVLPCTARSRSL